MKISIVLVVLSFWSSMAFADGLSPMQLKEVLPRAEVVVLAEISRNDVTIVERKPEKGPASVVYTCSIKAKVIEEVKGRAPKAIDINFTFTVVKGVWVAWSGSGLEQQMKPNEKYVLLLTSQGDILELLRAEKATELASIKNLLEQPEKKESATERKKKHDGPQPTAGGDVKPAPPVSSLPAQEQLSTDTFLGLRDNESRKVGDSTPESAVADVTTISTVSVSDYADYQKALHGGRIKAHGKRDGYIYYAIESRRDVPFQDGSSAWVDVTERYKAKIPYYKAPSTPAGVVSNFIREVSALATKHTELADFPEYVKRLEAQSQVEFKKDIKPFAVSFDKNTTPVLTKRRIRPSDCGTNGIFLQFVLDDGTNERQAPSDTVTYYPNLKLTLYAEVVLWEKASPELKKKLEDMVAGHKAMLLELDKATAKKPEAGDGK